MAKDSDRLIIKPYKDNHLAWVIDLCIIFIIPVLVDLLISLFSDNEVNWRLYGICFAICFAICAIVFMVRLFYKGRLIVTAEEVIKIHGTKIQFRIKREDLVSVCIRKVNPLIKLFVFLSSFIGDICTDLIFFRFYHADVYEERKFDGFIRIKSTPQEEIDQNLREFAESVTYRQAKKICELLDIPYSVIKN